MRLDINAPRIAMALLVAAPLGCGQPASPPAPMGTVAVIDLDAVAKDLGSDRQIAKSINERQSALTEQLVQLAKSYQAQLSQHQAAQAGGTAAPTSTPGVELASWQQRANANLDQAKKQVRSDLAQHRAQLVQQFREQIKPFARQAAQSRGLSVIVTKNDAVVYDFSDSVDITAAVLDAIRTHQQTASTETPAARVATRPVDPPRN
jgi:Skp family chaperone for outer membrane proteins